MWLEAGLLAIGAVVGAFTGVDEAALAIDGAIDLIDAATEAGAETGIEGSTEFISDDAGSNVVTGNTQDNTILGNGGSDTITGGSGEDTILGGSGNDRLLGNGDEDQISGGSGADTIKGGTGDDTLSGGSGNDRYVIQEDGGNDIINDTKGSRDKLVVNNSQDDTPVFEAVDNNDDGFIDSLKLNFSDDGSILIRNYFDNSAQVTSSEDLTDADEGKGHLETLIINGTSYSFDDVLDAL